MNPDLSILTLYNLSYSTPDGRALGANINVELGKGEILLITGPNGSGKSTLLEVILGRQVPFDGHVKLDTPRQAISYLPQMQDSQTHMPFSLRDALQVSTALNMDDEIESLGLLSSKQLNLGWNHASGGEKRRTLLTRIFLQKPELIVLDEPFNHLDIDSRGVMLSSLSRFVTERNNSVILSTHEGFENESDLSDLAIKHIAL